MRVAGERQMVCRKEEVEKHHLLVLAGWLEL